MSKSANLADIARSLLTESSLSDPQKVRETCGLLALLNLMGIVDAFFPKTEEEPKEEEERKKEEEVSPAKDASIAPSHDSDSASAITSLLSMVPKVASLSGQGGSQDTAQNSVASLISTMAKTLGQKESGLDPKALTSLLRLFSSMAKGKSSETAKEGSLTSQGEESAAPREVDSGAEGEPAKDAVPQPEVKDDASQEPASRPKDKPLPNSPGGPDPLEIITGFLNLLAGLDLGKSKSGISSKGKSAEDSEKSKEAKGKDDQEKEDTGFSVTRDGKAILFPLRKGLQPKEDRDRETLVHKPGLGIKRPIPRTDPGIRNQGETKGLYPLKTRA